MPGKTLLIRADASAEIGAGHVMRCLALAQAWQDAGGRTIFALASGIELESRIRAEGADVERIDAAPGSSDDAALTADLCRRAQAEWLVLDGYHFSADYRRAMRREATHLLLMDDSPERQPCECDVVLNPDPDASDVVYSQSGERPQYLLGPRYALLRREFLGARIPSDVAVTAQRILITMGGGDEHNVTLRVVQALQAISDLKLDVTVVVGANYQHRESLLAAVERSQQRARLLSNVQNMPELMAQADLAITAGGGTCYELAFMGVPMFLITTAKNHVRAVATFAATGAAFDAGWFHALTLHTLASSLRRIICDREMRARLKENASRMVDGKGAQRVVETMHAICQRSKHVPA